MLLIVYSHFDDVFPCSIMRFTYLNFSKKNKNDEITDQFIYGTKYIKKQEGMTYFPARLIIS